MSQCYFVEQIYFTNLPTNFSNINQQDFESSKIVFKILTK